MGSECVELTENINRTTVREKKKDKLMKVKKKKKGTLVCG